MKKIATGFLLLLMGSGLLTAQATKTTTAITKNDNIQMTMAVKKLSLEQLKNKYLNNQKKGKELFKLKQFKESITYSDKAILYQNILLEKLHNKEIALNKLKEADGWVQKAKVVVSP